MAETNGMQAVRTFVIDDDADGFQLYLFMDGWQVGGGFFPDFDGTGAVFHIAYQLGDSFVRQGA